MLIFVLADQIAATNPVEFAPFVQDEGQAALEVRVRRHLQRSRNAAEQ